MEDKKRLDYVDISKGVGMLAVVWGHIMLSGWSNLMVYAFHIPLFFFLSGMMFKPEKYNSLGAFLKRRFQTLIIPYVIYSIVTWIVWAGYSYIFNANVDSYWMPLFQTVIAQGSGGFMVHNVPLWFVTCLFMVEFFYYFRCKLPDFFNLMVCVIMAILACRASDLVVEGYRFDLMPWNIEVSFAAVLFYCLGNLLVKHVGLMNLYQSVKIHIAFSWIVVFVFTVLLVYSGLQNGAISMGHFFLGYNHYMFYINAFFGIISTVIFCILLSIIKTRYGGVILNYLIWFGRYSYDAMVIHVPIKGIIIVVLTKILAWSNVSNNMVYSIVAFVITMLVTSIIIWFINNGKRYYSNKLVKK